jgi:hypothetical protein
MRPAIFTSTWWRDLASRLVRQGQQVLIPVLAVVAQAGTVDVPAVAVALGIAAVLTFVRAAGGIRAADDAPWWVRTVDRATAAAAGSVLGLVTVDGVSLVAGLDPAAVAYAGLASAGIALLTALGDPGAPALSDVRTAR